MAMGRCNTLSRDSDAWPEPRPSSGTYVAKMTGAASPPVSIQFFVAVVGGPSEYQVSFTMPAVGNYSLNVTADGIPIPGSPFPLVAVGELVRDETATVLTRRLLLPHFLLQ